MGIYFALEVLSGRLWPGIPKELKGTATDGNASGNEEKRRMYKNLLEYKEDKWSTVAWKRRAHQAEVHAREWHNGPDHQKGR